MSPPVRRYGSETEPLRDPRGRWRWGADTDANPCCWLEGAWQLTSWDVGAWQGGVSTAAAECWQSDAWADVWNADAWQGDNA